MSIKRKVSFYLLSVKKYEEDRTRRVMLEKDLKPEKIEKIFEEILSDKMRTLANAHKAVNVTTKSNKYVVEVIEYKDHFAFLRIGQQNDANTVALRDQNTLESENVPMKDGQLLELFTYCLIDFTTGIISYIGINGAPRISAIQSMFNLYDQEKTVAAIAAIMTSDVFATLARKKIISKISLTVALPNDSVLSDVGVSPDDFDNIRHIKTSTATYNIVAPRNKNIFSSSGYLVNLMENVKEKFGDKLKSMSVNAKDDDETSQSYDLLEYNLTKTVFLGEDDSSKLTENDFESALKNTYNTYKEELKSYIR